MWKLLIRKQVAVMTHRLINIKYLLSAWYVSGSQTLGMG